MTMKYESNETVKKPTMSRAEVKTPPGHAHILSSPLKIEQSPSECVCARVRGDMRVTKQLAIQA